MRCILIFLQKDPNLSEILLTTVLDIWPYANTNKELAFLVTLYESLDVISSLENIQIYIEPLSKRISACLNSEHVQVIDRCMTFFERDSMINMLREYATEMYPIIVPPIERQIKEHWHETLKSNFDDLKKILMELDIDTYEEVKDDYQEKQEFKRSRRAELDSKWKILEDRIKDSQPNYIPPALPFQPDT